MPLLEGSVSAGDKGERINEKKRGVLTSHDRTFSMTFSRGGRGEVMARSHFVTGPEELLGGHSDHVLQSRSARGSPTTIIFGLGSRGEIARV